MIYTVNKDAIESSSGEFFILMLILVVFLIHIIKDQIIKSSW